MGEIKRSAIVVADTHFGSKKNGQECNPNAFSEFLNWIRRLERKWMGWLPDYPDYMDYTV